MPVHHKLILRGVLRNIETLGPLFIPPGDTSILLFFVDGIGQHADHTVEAVLSEDGLFAVVCQPGTVIVFTDGALWRSL